ERLEKSIYDQTTQKDEIQRKVQSLMTNIASNSRAWTETNRDDVIAKLTSIKTLIGTSNPEVELEIIRTQAALEAAKGMESRVQRIEASYKVWQYAAQAAQIKFRELSKHCGDTNKDIKLPSVRSIAEQTQFGGAEIGTIAGGVA